LTAISLKDVTVSFDGTRVVQGVTLDVRRGAWVGLIGPNGAGKTTLLRAVAGLVPFAGVVRLSGTPVSALGRRAVARLVAYVPQRPLTPASMAVTDYVLLGRTPHIPYLGREGRRDLEVVGGVLERLELTELAGRALGSLSGGEVQRAILGRALAQEAPVLLLDEPTSALDVGHQQQVLELVDELRREHALTVVSAMHDLTLAGQFTERLVMMDSGTVALEGSARSVLTEGAIRRHYRASVRVLDVQGGGVVVIATRATAGGPGDGREARA
jgi:iron complex transport system ATP-binding protein